MLWEIEIRPLGPDAECAGVGEEYNLLTHGSGAGPVAASARGYLLEGCLGAEDAGRLETELLVDPLVETGRRGALNEPLAAGCLATVLLKPGVMDPTARASSRRPATWASASIPSAPTAVTTAPPCRRRCARYSSARCCATKPSSRSSRGRWRWNTCPSAPPMTFVCCACPCATSATMP